MSEKIQVNIVIEKETLDFIDKAAEKDNRSRSNFFLSSAISKANVVLKDQENEDNNFIVS